MVYYLAMQLPIMSLDNSNISPLEAHLGYWLRFVSNHVSYHFKHQLMQHDITVAEWVILRTLYDYEQTSANTLVSQLSLSKGAISKLLKRLKIKGLIDNNPHAQDRRQQIIVLNSSGRALIPTLAYIADGNDALFFNALTDDEKTQLISLMKKLISSNNLQHVPLD